MAMKRASAMWKLTANKDGDFDILPLSLAPTRVVLVMLPVEKTAVALTLLVSLDAVGGIIVLESVVIGRDRRTRPRTIVLLFPWVTLLTKSPPSSIWTRVELTRRSDRYRLMSSYPSSSTVILRMMSSGRIARPGDMVEKIEKNRRIAIAAKKLRGVQPPAKNTRFKGESSRTC